MHVGSVQIRSIHLILNEARVARNLKQLLLTIFVKCDQNDDILHLPITHGHLKPKLITILSLMVNLTVEKMYTAGTTIEHVLFKQKESLEI